MRLRFYQVDCGDASSIMFLGNDGQTHHIFIDAGYERTYRDILSREIGDITEKDGQIDLWIISHIHDDHIGGTVSYIKDIQQEERKDIVSQWWFNSPYSSLQVDFTTDQVSEPSSFNQGDILTKYLLSVNKIPPFSISSESPIFNLAGLIVKPLTPTIEILSALRNKYKNRQFGNLDYKQLTEISESMASRTNDYNLSIDSLIKRKFIEDDSIENLSSISVLTTLGERSILWMADSVPSLLINRLKELRYSTDNPLQVDLVKVPHHGSSGNSSDELYSMIQSNKYIFSASGDNKHCLPTKESISRILKSAHRNPNDYIDLYFTFDNENIRNMFRCDGKDVFEKWKFRMNFPNSTRWLELIF